MITKMDTRLKKTKESFHKARSFVPCFGKSLTMRCWSGLCDTWLSILTPGYDSTNTSVQLDDDQMTLRAFLRQLLSMEAITEEMLALETTRNAVVDCAARVIRQLRRAEKVKRGR